jgi:hypothetical protein
VKHVASFALPLGVVAFVGAASFGAATASCTKLSAPCTASHATTIVTDPAAAGRSLSLSEGAGGTTVARWLVNAPLQADAGASLFTPPVSLEVLVLSADLATTKHSSFPAPPELTARTGNTTTIDASFTGKGALFHWVETVVTQDPGGATHDTSVLLASFVSASGAASAPRTLATCVDCTLAAASGVSASFAYIVFRAQKDTAGVLRVSSDGSAVDVLPFPSWAGATGALPALSLSNGQLVARTPSAFSAVDDELALIAGPFAVGVGGDAAFDWSPTAPLAMTLGQAGGGEGGVSDLFGFSAGQDVPNLLLTTYGAAPRTTRISTANAIEGTARDDDALGVAFTADERDYFALVGADGEKRGGDLDLGATTFAAAPRIVRSGPSHYAVLQLRDGALTKREVSCEE